MALKLTSLPTSFCQESSFIHSNAGLGVQGQGSINLSGPGDCIEAQRLVLSLFSSIKVSNLLVYVSYKPDLSFKATIIYVKFWRVAGKNLTF